MFPSAHPSTERPTFSAMGNPEIRRASEREPDV
jgi:hypothetical protein